MAFSWIVYCIIIGLIIGLTSIAILFRKKTRAQDNSSTQQKYLFSKKVLPISRSKGWQLLSISHGIRIWKRNENDHKAWIPNAIYGSYMIISASVKDIMETVRNPSLLQEWDATIEHVSQVTLEDDSDVLSVKPQKTGVLWKIACWFGKTWDEDINIVISRYWQSTEDKEGWSFWLSREHNMFYNSTGWSCFTVTKLDNDKNIPKCMVSVIACPSSCDHETIYQSTSAKLAALKDYFKCFHLHPVHLEDEVETSSGIGDTDDSSNKSVSKSEVKQLTERTESKQEKQSGIQPEKKSYETRYQNEIEQATKSLMSSYEAADGDDHWVLVGNIKGVHILKRPAQPGERPWECFKGTTTINVPVNYILAYAFSLDHRGEYDDMYNRGEVIEEMNPLTKVNRMEFKPVWPSTARDFCNFGAVLDLGEGLYGVVSQSVEHDNCPAKKGFVRAELLFAGFVVKEESSDPPSCQVSYISKADLKGNLPVRIVNRVAQSQPQNLAIFRSKLEERYTNDMRIPAENKSPFHKSAQDLWKELMKVRELKCKNATSLEDKDSAVAESDTSDLLTGEGSSVSGKSEGGQNDSDFEDSFNTLEVTDENLKLPLMDRQIDYRTLGNQAAATLLGELVLASRVEISLAVTDNLPQEEKEGEWGFHMVEKDVIILKKVSSGEKIHSYLGKGLIKVSPLTVWQAVTNHMTRHLYDKTLKKIKLVKRIDEQTKILYHHHEAAQCFVKQSRDFVILYAERVESERYISAGVSVDYPDCPPQKNLVRGKLLSGGWVIEPALQNGQLHSMVSYMCQINFGGSTPVRLLNYVGKRQPLCIAYLREYLENGDERWH